MFYVSAKIVRQFLLSSPTPYSPQFQFSSIVNLSMVSSFHCAVESKDFRFQFSVGVGVVCGIFDFDLNSG